MDVIKIEQSLKHQQASSCGINGMAIQGATTLFLDNMKRIIKLKEEKKKNIEG